MENDMEIVIDALFSVTDLDAYEIYNMNPNKEPKDISFFKRKIYEGDIVKLLQDENGFTNIIIDEDGKRKKIRIFETIEEIQSIINKMEILKNDNTISSYLNQKLSNLNKKNLKKFAILKK